MNRRQLLKRRLILVPFFIVAYLAIGVIAFCIIGFIGRTIITSGTESELGRMADGMAVAFFGTLSSFCVIPSAVLLVVLILVQTNRKRKRKVKNDFLVSD